MSSSENTTDFEQKPNQPPLDPGVPTDALPPLPPLPTSGQPQFEGAPLGPSTVENPPLAVPASSVPIHDGGDVPPINYQPPAQYPSNVGATPLAHERFATPLEAPAGQPSYAGVFPVPTPIQPQDPNAFGPTLRRAFKAIPQVFSTVTKGRAGHAFRLSEENKLYWVVIMVAGGIGYALLMPLAIADFSRNASVGASRFLTFGASSHYVHVGPSFGTYVGLFTTGLIFWCASYAIQALVIFFTWRFCHGRGSYRSALSLLAVSFTPITAVIVVWAVLGLIPSTIWFLFLTVIAAIALVVFALGSIILNYIGINQYERLGVSPFVPYVLLALASAVVIGILGVAVSLVLLP